MRYNTLFRFRTEGDTGNDGEEKLLGDAFSFLMLAD